MASAVKTAIIALYGPTDHTRTYPLGSDSLVLRKDLICSPCNNAYNKQNSRSYCRGRIDCLQKISADTVFDAVKRKLPMNKRVREIFEIKVGEKAGAA